MNLKDAGIYDLINIFTGQTTQTHSASLGGGVINNRKRIINIPAYQRPYRWGEARIKQLFSDYDDNRGEYFIGSAVAVQRDKKDGTCEFDLVDGQQRITTLYLLSYIRFLLKREYVFSKLMGRNQFQSSELCRSLRDSYVDLVGKTSKPFDNILSTINDLTDNETLTPEELSNALSECYARELCIADEKSTVEETLKNRYEKNLEFFKDETLCLKYSRKQYDKILKNALCSVYLKSVENTNRYELDTIIDGTTGDFSNNYITAMQTIFKNLWDRATIKAETNGQGNISKIDICKKAIELSDEIINNMSICIVLTANENDAYKLFEVLNDRSLEVEDLELIKNHFYKEYCTKSDDSEERQDRNIGQLEELWVDKIFNNNTAAKTRLISYLAAVYLTCDKELDNKNDTRFKNAIAQKYSSQYSAEGKKYTFNCILSDFNAYYAIKIILDKMDLKAQRLYAVCLENEQKNKSITYKTFHLLNALGFPGVMSAIINVIISSFINQYGNEAMYCEDFEKTFCNYIENLINDKDNNISIYSKIHKCSYTLRIAAMKGKDYRISREVAKRIIETNGHNKYSTSDLELRSSEISDLNKEFENWLSTWKYDGDDKKNFILKIMFLNLLTTKKQIFNDRVTLKPDALNYVLNADRLQLDHLEAKVHNESMPEKYYCTNNLEKRATDVNNYLGNFMILDAKENNSKKNIPLCQALDFYVLIDNSWLISDIKNMLSDENYFSQDTKVPKEAFFVERSKQLKKYFKALLNKELEQSIIEVEI